MRYGILTTPTLKELRASSALAMLRQTGNLKLEEIVADVQQLHADPTNAGALFQVASQFNLLEMVGPRITPEHGIDIYENDPTQGPACAIACGAATIYRNYFVKVRGQRGQTEDRQIDCLADLGAALGNDHEQLWQMRNGYALPNKPGLDEITNRLESSNEDEFDRLRETLRIGVQTDVDVTICEQPHQVSQAFCSALPVAYSSISASTWERFAKLVLEAAYEATFHAAVLNSAETGNNRLFLTLLGGGAFGNRMNWIIHAIQRSLTLFKSSNLKVAIVSYGAPTRSVTELVQRFQSSQTEADR
jgi:hypothetical protein